MKTTRFLLLCFIVVGLTSCATTSSHQFATPAPAWKTRTGQLAYRGPQTSLIGEVLVRTSPAGDMELTFSKAPALTLMTIRQDAQFASAEGPLGRGRWAGETSTAPERLRGWFSLREKILAGGSSVQVTNGLETFNLRF
jgi:outer membrane biogenesis lipoprotein LolB